jgi:hypothetical protein
MAVNGVQLLKGLLQFRCILVIISSQLWFMTKPVFQPEDLEMRLASNDMKLKLLEFQVRMLREVLIDLFVAREKELKREVDVKALEEELEVLIAIKTMVCPPSP